MKRRAYVRDDKLVIELPLSLLRSGVEGNDELQLKIKNLRKAASWYAKNIWDFILPWNSERGISELENLLDELAIEAYESGEIWLEGTNEPSYRE